jgi:hypothetical protein
MNYQNESEFKQLLKRVQAIKPLEYVLEIGSLHGETLFHWINSVDSGGTVVSLDMIVPPIDSRHEAQKLGHEVTWHEWARSASVKLFCFDRDSTDPETVRIVRGLVPRLDFLFIDGGHDFRTCCLDYQNYQDLVRPGGIIAFHDLGSEYPDVRKVWDNIKEPGEREEICSETAKWGIGILHKP